jgi:hypothetical protein
MSKLKPQTRFLLRGSALLVTLLSLWWFLLLPPMLYLLKGAAGVFLPIQETTSGDWTLHVPLEKTLPATPQGPEQQVHSIDFDVRHSDVIAFTFSLPLYWAIILAAPGVRRNLRALLLGTAVMAAVEVAMMLLFAEISARNTAALLAGGGGDAIAGWARLFGGYLLASVLPYATPFVVALWLHRGLRAEIFPWSIAVKVPAPLPAADRAQGRRSKKHRP